MIWIALLGLLVSFSSFAQKDPQIEALIKRIDQLEKQQEELLLSSEKNSNQVSSFLKDGLTLGGFFESAFTVFDGPDTEFMAMHTGSTMGLNLSADFSDKLRFVNQTLTFLNYPLTNPHNDPRHTPALPKTREIGNPFFGAIVTAGYLEFAIDPQTVVQTGVGYVPFGYAAQQRELVLFIRRGGPQLLRSQKLFSPLWQGIHLAGQTTSRKAGYHLYTTNSVDNESNVAGMGGRLWGTSLNDELKFGVSSQVMKFEGHTTEVLGTDVRFENAKFIVTSEYATHLTGDGRDPWTAYVEPAIKLNDGEFLLFTFADYVNNTINETVTTPDPITIFEYGIGMNWLPTSNTRFRATAAREDYLGSQSTIQSINRDFWYFDLSAGVAF